MTMTTPPTTNTKILTILKMMPLLILPLLVRGISKPRLYYLNQRKQYCIYAIAITSAKTGQRRQQSQSSSSSLLLKLRGGDGGNGNNQEDDDQTTIQYKAIQVQIIHRHGDRTPITTMRDVEYWKSQLIAPQIIEKISEGTRLIKRHNQPSNNHQAYGQGPFGKLTQLGLFQLIDVGTTIRQELVCSKGGSTSTSTAEDNNVYYDGTIFDEHNNRPLHPNHIKVISTDFPRTIQSVQGLLIGLFPDGLPQEVEIDCRHTNWMIPDPQPRHTQEQSLLEKQLSQRPHLRSKEKDMRELAVRCTESLRELLGKNAFDVSYGVGEESTTSGKKLVLPWAQLAEITTCLRVRDMLPPTISDDDQQQISNHCAWRWFESLRNPRLCYLAMHHFTHTILHSMRHFVSDDGGGEKSEESEGPSLIIYSGHDSTLIGLLCAFRLEQPSIWPEYGSYLKIELLEKQSIANNNENEVVVVDKEHVVRFYLNGNLLRSQWQQKQHDDDQQGEGEGGEVELRDEISLQELSHHISTEGSKTTSNYDEILK